MTDLPLNGVSSLTEIRKRLDDVDYLVDDGLAMALFLVHSMGQPLLLEGEPGVGKTTAAKALAECNVKLKGDLLMSFVDGEESGRTSPPSAVKLRPVARP